VGKDAFETLARRIGLTPEKTVIFYGDKNNWWATYALWVFQLFGHTNAKIIDGGRKKWEAEGRELTREVPPQRQRDSRLPRRSSQARAGQGSAR
jgi:thiosulfate/3-mercaptopyruvate sulfurtransferase